MAPQVGLEPTTDRLTADSSPLSYCGIILAWQRPTLTGTRSQLPSALELNFRVRYGNGVTSLPSLPDFIIINISFEMSEEYNAYSFKTR